MCIEWRSSVHGCRRRDTDRRAVLDWLTNAASISTRMQLYDKYRITRVVFGLGPCTLSLYSHGITVRLRLRPLERRPSLVAGHTPAG